MQTCWNRLREDRWFRICKKNASVGAGDDQSQHSRLDRPEWQMTTEGSKITIASGSHFRKHSPHLRIMHGSLRRCWHAFCTAVEPLRKQFAKYARSHRRNYCILSWFRKGRAVFGWLVDKHALLRNTAGAHLIMACENNAKAHADSTQCKNRK